LFFGGHNVSFYLDLQRAQRLATGSASPGTHLLESSFGWKWLKRIGRFIFIFCDRLAERSEKGLDRGKSAVKYRVFIGFFADSISDLESFRAFRLNMYLARNG
jgi:hypothetical protein